MYIIGKFIPPHHWTLVHHHHHRQHHLVLYLAPQHLHHEEHSHGPSTHAHTTTIGPVAIGSYRSLRILVLLLRGGRLLESRLLLLRLLPRCRLRLRKRWVERSVPR